MEDAMKKTIITLLICTAIGLILTVVGLILNITGIWFIGLLLFAFSSAICGYKCGAKEPAFLNYEASNVYRGCVVFPIYALLRPFVTMLYGFCLIFCGWYYGLKTLSEI